MQDYVLRSE
jgi:hypothetical protein